jgi:serine/threonine protein kinase, bacterial
MVGGTESDSRVESRFGPYRLLRLIGRGGMGEVYEAEDTRKRRVVALKLISAQFSGNPLFRARMQREADAAGRLTEPHVVPIHDYGEINGQLYLDMRLIDGVSLRSMLAGYGPLTPPRAVAIVRQIAAALDAAHATAVTHRDVKPENILITRDDFAYLVDFGIARAATDPGLTQTGMAMGTYNYMAPERFTGDDVTYRSDIYSLACVLGECLTGSPPYRADSIERLVAAHLMEPAPRPSQLRPGTVPVALDQVVARGMAKKPEDRYRSAGELAAAALSALTAAEQHQASAILQHGAEAAVLARAAAATLPGTRTDYTDYTASGAALDTARRWGAVPAPSSRTASALPPNVAEYPDFAGAGASSARRNRKRILIGAAALVVVVAIGVAGYLVTRGPHPSASASGVTVLPFTGLDFRLSPGGVAVDSAGSVYVTSEDMFGRVVKLAAGSSAPTVLPFSGLYQPQGLAVDASGALYVADFNNRVVKLAAGANTQSVLPFTGLNYPEGVAVDVAGSVYVADRGNNRVVKLDVGSGTQRDLPFAGLKNPDGVAVDTAGTVYVTDSDNGRVLKLDPGSGTPTVLPYTGLTVPWGIAVDTAGAVYVTDHDTDKLLKLAAGATASIELPFPGADPPLGVAVDAAGKYVFVADNGNNRVMELAAG